MVVEIDIRLLLGTMLVVMTTGVVIGMLILTRFFYPVDTMTTSMTQRYQHPDGAPGTQRSSIATACEMPLDRAAPRTVDNLFY